MFILLPALLALLIALLIGLKAEWLGERLSLLDFPGDEKGLKLHQHVTPLVGGLAIGAAAIIGTGALMLSPDPGVARPVLVWFAATVLGMMLIGIADDRFGLTAPFRLALTTSLLLAAIVQVPDFQLSFLLFSGQDQLIVMPGLVGIGFTLLCLVGLLNAVNMADGKNGLVIGQALIWTAVLMVRLPDSLLPLLVTIAAVLAVLFLFNLKGHLFLGDGGSYGLSAMFGLLAILAWNKGFADMRSDDVALIFAVPVFDTLRLIVQRLANRRSPLTGGRDHLHHYLYARWGWPAPLPWVLALVALPNIGAILLPGTGLFWLALTLAGYFTMLWLAVQPLRARVA